MRYIVPNDDKVRTIPLGRAGEKNYTEIAFDISEWQKEFATIDSIVLLMQGSQDNLAYAVETTIEGKYLVHTVTDVDLRYSGNGKCQLQLLSGDVIAKSRIYNTSCCSALNYTNVPPNPWEDWLQHMIDLTAEATAAADDAKDYALEAKGHSEDAADSARDANTYRGDASGFADAASASALSAASYAGDIEDLTVTSASVPAGTAPSVTKTHPTGQPINLAFSIPEAIPSLWVGSQNDYDNLPIHNPDVLYFIVDGVSTAIIPAGTYAGRSSGVSSVQVFDFNIPIHYTQANGDYDRIAYRISSDSEGTIAAYRTPEDADLIGSYISGGVFLGSIDDEQFEVLANTEVSQAQYNSFMAYFVGVV